MIPYVDQKSSDLSPLLDALTIIFWNNIKSTTMQSPFRVSRFPARHHVFLLFIFRIEELISKTW